MSLNQGDIGSGFFLLFRAIVQKVLHGILNRFVSGKIHEAVAIRCFPAVGVSNSID